MNCERFGLSPADFGFDIKDPRIVRSINVALNIYQIASEKKEAEKMEKRAARKDFKPNWGRDNPEKEKLLKWARSGAVEMKDEVNSEFLVRIEIPQKSQ